MYIDAAYCYRPSSVVCRSVCRSVTLVSPAKTAEAIELPLGLRTRVGPRNHVLDGVQIPPREGIILRGQRGVLLWSIGTLCGHLCKNGWTDRDAVLVMGSDGPKESRVRWGPEVLRNGAMATIFGFRWAISSSSSSSSMQWTTSICNGIPELR